jgi:hypothetical protein
MLLDLLDEAATEQGFINHMDDIRSYHEPEKKISGTVISLASQFLGVPTLSLRPRYNVRLRNRQTGQASCFLGGMLNRTPLAGKVELGFTVADVEASTAT